MIFIGQETMTHLLHWTPLEALFLRSLQTCRLFVVSSWDWIYDDILVSPHFASSSSTPNPHL